MGDREGLHLAAGDSNLPLSAVHDLRSRYRTYLPASSPTLAAERRRTTVRCRGYGGPYRTSAGCPKASAPLRLSVTAPTSWESRGPLAARSRTRLWHLAWLEPAKKY